MRHIHRRIFRLYLMEQDGLPLTPGQRTDLRAHLANCPACQTDQLLLRRLRAESGWHVTPPPVSAHTILKAAGSQIRLHRLNRSLQIAVLVALAVLALFLTQWALTRLIPTPAGLPAGSPTPAEAHPTPLPAQPALQVFPAVPVYTGTIFGDGLWSQEERLTSPRLCSPRAALGRTGGSLSCTLSMPIPARTARQSRPS